MPPATVLSCGDKIDTRLNNKVLISDITITFRSNEAVTKSGASFLVTEWLPKVYTYNNLAILFTDLIVYNLSCTAGCC